MDYESLFNTLMQELKDGVVVCTADGKLALFNQSAEELLGRGKPLRQGVSLYELCCQMPVERAIGLLQYQHKLEEKEPLPFVQFMNTDIGQENFFRCRLSIQPSQPPVRYSFVIVFEDITSWYAPGNPLYIKIEEFRAPMTNLKASIENLTEHPEMSPVMRSAFENVLVQESVNLTEAFDSLSSSCKNIMQTRSFLTGLDTAVLFGYLAEHLAQYSIAAEVSPGPEAEVLVDIYALILVLDYLVGKIQLKQKNDNLLFKAHVGEQFVYFDLMWPGDPLTTGEVKSILQDTLQQGLGGVTVAAILNTMDGDIWSQQLENASNVARLALPIGASSG